MTKKTIENELIEGLQEVVAHKRGSKKLHGQTRELSHPAPDSIILLAPESKRHCSTVFSLTSHLTKTSPPPSLFSTKSNGMGPGANELFCRWEQDKRNNMSRKYNFRSIIFSFSLFYFRFF